MQDTQEIPATTWFGLFAIVIVVLEFFHLTQQHTLNMQLEVLGARIVGAEESIKLLNNTSGHSGLTPDKNVPASSISKELLAPEQSSKNLNDINVDIPESTAVISGGKAAANPNLSKDKKSLPRK